MPLLELELQRRQNKKEEYEKEIKKAMHKVVKTYHIKFSYGDVFVSLGDYFFRMNTHVSVYSENNADTTILNVIVSVKTLESDSLFWKAINMEYNLKKPERYHTNGQNIAPMYGLREKDFDIDNIESTEVICKMTLSYFQEIINDFIMEFTILNYFIILYQKKMNHQVAI